MKKTLIVIVPAFCLAAYLLYRHFIPDDAFIHVGYAKDLLAGRGYSFTGNRTYGSTAPLWPPLIAAVGFFAGNLIMTARVLSLVFAVASIITFYYTARLRFSEMESLAATFLLSANAYFLRWSLTGMESTAAVFFMVLLITTLYKENDGTLPRAWYILIGLAPLVRPEFYLFFFLFFLYALAVRPRRLDPFKVILAALPSLIWLAFAEAYYGTITPTTFLAKAGEPFFTLQASTLYRLLKLYLSGSLVETIFIVLAAVALAAKDKGRKQLKGTFESESILLFGFVASFYVFYGLKDVLVISRYSLVLTPPIILVAIELTRKSVRSLGISPRLSQFVLIAMIGASLFYSAAFTWVIVKPDADAFYKGFQTTYSRMAGILHDKANANSQVALSDVGLIGVYSGCRVDDLNGLVDKDRFRYATSEEFINSEKPEFLIARGEVDLNKLRCSLTQIYEASLPGFGINSTHPVEVRMFRASWTN